eukprot:191537-Pelagomonas_calceolata.AAC.1
MVALAMFPSSGFPPRSWQDIRVCSHSCLLVSKSWVSMWVSAVVVWKEESKSGCFEGLHVDGTFGKP